MTQEQENELNLHKFTERYATLYVCIKDHQALTTCDTLERGIEVHKNLNGEIIGIEIAGCRLREICFRVDTIVKSRQGDYKDTQPR